MRKKTGIIISAIAVTGLLVTGAIILILNNKGPKIPFRLDDEYYTSSGSEIIDSAKYEELIANKKSFLVMIDKPGCVITQSMRNNMSNFPSDMQFKYYHMYWDEVTGSSLHEYVKFTPSVAIIHEGKVLDWLQADKDEDTEYFEDAEALQRWIRQYIEF